jgi:hypothetical protein
VSSCDINFETDLVRPGLLVQKMEVKNTLGEYDDLISPFSLFIIIK